MEKKLKSSEERLFTYQKSKIESNLKKVREELVLEEEAVESRGFYNPRDPSQDSSGISELDLSDTRSITRIYELLQECTQWDLKANTFTNKLVRLKCWIDLEDRKVAERGWEGRKMPEIILCSGAFAVLEVYTVPMDYVKIESHWNPSLGEYQTTYLIDYHKFGKELPPTSEVAYNTFLPCTESFGVCLALRGPYSWLRPYISNTWNWEYVQCDL